MAADRKKPMMVSGLTFLLFLPQIAFPALMVLDPKMSTWWAVGILVDLLALFLSSMRDRRLFQNKSH
jgi:hypothetical protein